MSEVKIGRCAIVVAFASLIALTGCASNSSAPTVVMAQSGYTNASLTGNYAFQLLAPYDKNTAGLSYSQIGTLTLDGTGKITSGSSTAYFSNSTLTCAYTITGTYSVTTGGAGTASVTSTATSASQSSGCTAPASTSSLNFQVAGSGSTFVFVDTDGSIFGGTAIKQ